MDKVEDAIGNVTSWFRRYVMGALEHQHAPVSTDEDGLDGGNHHNFDYRQPYQPEQEPPWWMKWSSSAPNGYNHNYSTALQFDSDAEIVRDEQTQMDEAIRRSKEERERRREMEEREEEEREIERALEISRKEAEKASGKSSAAPSAPPPTAPVIGDLISLDEGDFLGLGGASTGGGGPNSSSIVPFDANSNFVSSSFGVHDSTANDEILARTLQLELNLLDAEVGPSESDLLTKIGGRQNPQSAFGDDDLLSLASSGNSVGVGGAGGAGGGGDLSSALVPVIPFKPFKESQLVRMGKDVCGGCSKPISYGRFLTIMGHSWHPQCFRCTHCNLPITETEFRHQEGSAYHSQCYLQLFHPKCHVCAQYIPVKEGGMIEFRSSPFWGDRFCPSHENDGTPSCASCHRLEQQGTPYVDLDDGRKICLSCVESVVVDLNDCTPLFLEVQNFYESLGMKITQTIPLLCVETQALNAARNGEKKGSHHTGETRGLCLSEEQTIQTVVRVPGASRGSRFGGIGEQTLTLTRHCQVTAILVLYGLPQLLTGSILAHELMHAWIRLDGGFPPLSPEIDEGLCQAMAHMWLQSQLHAETQKEAGAGGGMKPVDESNFRAKFAEFCMFQIASDPSLVYGEGFRRAYSAIVQFGLKPTLDHVRATGAFP